MLAVIIIIILSGVVVAAGVWLVTDSPLKQPLPAAISSKKKKKSRPIKSVVASSQAELPLDSLVDPASKNNKAGRQKEKKNELTVERLVNQQK